MSKVIDLTGRTFHRLTVIRHHSVVNRTYKWECLCECGTTTVVDGSKLKNGHTKSCGCLLKEFCAKPKPYKQTHNLSNTRTYRIWQGMMARCYKLHNHAYQNYGGRGITVCERWHSVTNFVADMGEAPECATIERVNNNAGYSPDNCKWASPKEQVSNRRVTFKVTWNGETRPLTEWADIYGFKYHALYNRIVVHKWPLSRAFNQPYRVRRHSSLANDV